jgi:hypothetical protein
MPPHEGIGGNQRIEFQKRFAPDCLCFSSQECPLGIGEPDSLSPKPLLQHPVLGLKELDDDQLTPMHPA